MDSYGDMIDGDFSPFNFAGKKCLTLKSHLFGDSQILHIINQVGFQICVNMTQVSFPMTGDREIHRLESK